MKAMKVAGTSRRWRTCCTCRACPPAGRRSWRVAGHAFALLQEVGFAGEVADQAAGLGDQQRAGGHVPGRQAGLEEAVGEAGGHVGQVERGGAGAAQAGGALHDVGHHAQVDC
jgi:hypothetical protein